MSSTKSLTQRNRDIPNEKAHNSLKISEYRKQLKELYGVEIPWKTAMKRGVAGMSRMVNDEKDKQRAKIKRDAKKEDKKPLSVKKIKDQATLKENLEKLKGFVKSGNINRTLRINNRWFTLNADNIRLLKDVMRNGSINLMEDYAETYGSDVDFLQDFSTEVIQDVGLIKAKKGQKPKKSGAFFPYYHKMDIDLSKYGIFRSHKDADYRYNCLYLALKAGGLSAEKLEKYDNRFSSKYIQTKDMALVADYLEIRILLYVDGRCRQYGEGDEYHIGIMESHYFIRDKSPLTSYAIENYDEAIKYDDWNHITKVKDKLWTSEKNTITSHNMFRLLMEHKDVLLEDVELDEEFTKLFKEKRDTDKKKQEIKFLEYKDSDVEKYKDVDPTREELKKHYYAKVKGKEDKKMGVYFFDTETYTIGTHEPYLCCYVRQSEESGFVRWNMGYVRTTYGEKCCYDMMLDISKRESYGFVLYAHNMKYDVSFLVRHLFNVKVLKVGGRVLSVTGSFRNPINGKIKKVIVKDTYCMISLKLAKFTKSFGLKYDKDTTARKELINYELYNEIKRGNVDQVAKVDFIADNYYANDKEHFLNNVKEWELEKDGKLDLLEYSKKYCMIDVVILMQGYNVFRGWIYDMKLTNGKKSKIDIYYVISSASLADKYMKLSGCFDGCYSISNTPREFIKKCVVGGRVMCANNKKQKFTGDDVDISDYDAVSLYPSAIHRLNGYLKGVPKVIKEGASYDDIKDYDGYYVQVLIRRVNVNRSFPLLSVIREDGTRHFGNKMGGKTLYMDKTSLEDAIRYHNIEFKIVRGYYFDEGFNKKCKKTIDFIFQERLKMKAEGNEMQSVYKLIMNSAYGKTIMKEQETEEVYFNKVTEAEVYMTNNPNRILEAHKLSDEMVVVKRRAFSDDHFNYCHIGCQVLSMSKRIMNEVITTAEDNDIPIYYQDTDSMHLDTVNIPKLESLFYEKYGKTLKGKSMGQFHTDFELDGYDGKNRIYADKSIFLGKKCYIDRLRVESESDQLGYHIRMKGVSNKSIYHRAELDEETPLELYQRLYEGEEVVFDLLCKDENGNSTVPSFKFTHFEFTTNTEFNRAISF